jgi:hypothetical protein
MPYRKFIMNKVVRAFADLDEQFLVDFFRSNPIIAERCRVAIIIATEEETQEEVRQTELPFPHAEPL